MNNNLNNEQFLAKVIELYKIIHANDVILLLNLNGIVLYTSNKVEELTGMTPSQVIGKNYLDSLPLPEENIPKIINSIDNTIKTRNTHEFLSVNLNRLAPNAFIFQCILKPIINPNNNEVVAISSESRQFNSPIYFYKMLIFTQTKQVSKVKHTDKLLTLREHEIGFLLFYCKSANRIAQILSTLYDKPISTKTINNIIRQQLYTKFEVYNLEALQDKLYNHGYHKNIPVSFLCNLYLDLNEI